MELIKPALSTPTSTTEPADWGAVLHAISSRAKPEVVDAIAGYLTSDFARGRINTLLRQAHFLAQAACETDGFRTLEEYGNAAYFRRYDGRRDLGNVFPGDGYRFRGRGIFDLTGRANYTREGERLGVDLVKHPDLAAGGDLAVQLAVDYWTTHHCNPLADEDNIVAVTREINGGLNGLSARRQYLARAKQALNSEVPTEAEPHDRERVKGVQDQLRARGYTMVGESDGLIGSATVAALSAFQHDNELPITGDLDQATEDALFASDDKRPIDDTRAASEPVQSRILTNSRSLLTSSKAAIGIGGAGTATGLLDQAESTRDYIERVQAVFSPFHAFIASHMSLVILGVGAGVFVFASKIVAARIEDHQTRKTA